MASKCSRFLNRASVSSLKSAFKNSSASSSSSSSPCFSSPSASRSIPTSFSQFSKPTSSSTVRRFSLSRIPSELGCVQSMLPLHSAVATARMTSCLSASSRSCRALSQGYVTGATTRVKSQQASFTWHCPRGRNYLENGEHYVTQSGYSLLLSSLLSPSHQCPNNVNILLDGHKN